MTFDCFRIRLPLSVLGVVTAGIAAIAGPTMGCSTSADITSLLPDKGLTFDAGHPPQSDASVTFDAGSADTGPVACTPNPSCGLPICQCASGEQFAVETCSATCDVTSACQAACGGAPTSTTTLDSCSGGGGCGGGNPYIDCRCTAGAWTASPTCTPGGYCSAAAEDVCPKACASEGSGSWTGCKQDSDCGPTICECGDGSRPVHSTGGLGNLWGKCVSPGVCEPPSTFCPTACASRGGWTPPTTAQDAGVDAAHGEGDPGDPCTSSSDCKALSCTCSDSKTFGGVRGCNNDTNTCSDQSDVCPFFCINNGGWSGH